MKLVSNLLVAVNNAAAAEAMALADRAGLDRDQVARLVAVSSGSSRQWETRAPQMAARRYAPAIGAVATLEAVLEVIDDTARTLGAATPLYDLARASYARALAEGRGGDDIACLFEDARAAPLKA
ncbi:MAG: NAD(P)-dependent oxidoreductase [Alphaproteobacteria bacterium]|nr:NAD(P)-dependent oxidoreductase [Alphaproteobacteria bacterium]